MIGTSRVSVASNAGKLAKPVCANTQQKPSFMYIAIEHACVHVGVYMCARVHVHGTCVLACMDVCGTGISIFYFICGQSGLSAELIPDFVTHAGSFFGCSGCCSLPAGSGQGQGKR